MFGITFFCRKVARFFMVLSIVVTFVTIAPLASAACSYQVENEWNSGYVASINIKNDTDKTVSQWSVNWQFAQDQVSNSWNANVTGTNPYSASNLDWNKTIQPGQAVEFGFQGTKSNSSAQVPVITGSVCQ